MWISVIFVIAAYLVGTLNFAYFLGKRHGEDIREKGSGNAGGSNALILYGAKAGAVVILADMLKAFLVVRLTMHFTQDPYTPAIAAVAVILGHMFPFYMRFRGGKGLACLGGSIIALSPPLALVLLILEIILLLGVDYLVILPLTLSILFPIAYGVQTRNIFVALILLIPAVPMWLKHIENLKRIRLGQETHCLRFLYNKEEEFKRTGIDPDEHR